MRLSSCSSVERWGRPAAAAAASSVIDFFLLELNITWWGGKKKKKKVSWAATNDYIHDESINRSLGCKKKWENAGHKFPEAESNILGSILFSNQFQLFFIYSQEWQGKVGIHRTWEIGTRKCWYFSLRKGKYSAFNCLGIKWFMSLLIAETF